VWLTAVRWPALWSRSGPPRQAGRPLARPRLEALEGRWLPSTFLVTTPDDTGAGSLRQAILDANATPGTNEIDFAIGNGGAQTIRPRSDLPYVTRPVIIDGTTQPGFAGSPLIDLDGGAAAYVNGLTILASDSTVRGLAFTNFAIPDDPCTFLNGLTIFGSRNVVEGNYIGIDLTGTQPMGNSIGVMVEGSDNRIGGTTDAQRNLISGNDLGVSVFGSDNVVLGNYIGTDVTGTVAVGNGDGVGVAGANNRVGGTTAEARNVISGNRGAGITIQAYESSTGIAVPNQVQGNYLGTDVTGTRALGNNYGVILHGLSLPGNHIIIGGSNRIGGTEPGAGNLISGNRVYGVQISGGRDGQVIQGNRIGTDVTGTQAVGNGIDGVFLYGTSKNLIGGAEAGAGNLISGNGWNGILITNYASADGSNVVQGNLIGTDVSGTQPLGNGRDGVQITRLNNNTIGGEDTGAGNTIAFNGGDGVRVDQANGNAILGNAVFANGGPGIELLHGANHVQPAPVLTSATTDGTGTTVTGTLTSTPNATFTLEFFANDLNDPSGSGERFLGSVVVTTDADGHASFTLTLDAAVNPGWFLTATATDPANNSSGFSAGFEVAG
jgi:hypothetical protein